MKIEKNFKIPIVIVELYLLLTEIIFFVGPIKWGDYNTFKLIIFLLFSHVFLYIGYNYGVKRTSKNFSNIKQEEKEYKLNVIMNNLKILMILMILINIAYIIIKVGSISNILNKIVIGFLNPSANYNNKFNTKFSRLYSTFAPIYVVSAFFTFSVIPVSLYFFKKLNKFYKFLTILNILIEISKWLITGTNKGIIDVILIIIFIFLLKFLQDKKNIKPKFRKVIRVKEFILKIFLIILLITGLLFFINNINGRLLGKTEYILISLNNATFKEDLFYKHIPQVIKTNMTYIQSYISQGYYGLGLALDMNFVPMFGIGHSTFLIENIGNVLDNDFYLRNYTERISYLGWSSTVNWHTAYTWFANDLSFTGVVFLMFFIGFYFSKIVNHVMEKDGVIFISLFVIMMIMFFYFPMNNQIFNNPIQFMGFCGLNIFWIIRKMKTNRR